MLALLESFIKICSKVNNPETRKIIVVFVRCRETYVTIINQADKIFYLLLLCNQLFVDNIISFEKIIESLKSIFSITQKISWNLKK